MKKHNREKAASILMLVIMTISMLLPSGCQSQDKTKIEEIQEKGVLKVGTTGDYMPMSYLDPKTGEYVGFDTELTEDLLDYVNEFLSNEKESGRIDELAEEYFYKYVEDEALEPAA